MRAYVGVLAGPVFRRYYAAQSASMLGDAFAPTAIALCLVGTGDDGTWLSTFLAAVTLPRLVVTLAGGVLGDALPKLPLLMAGFLARGCLQLATGLLFLLDGPLLAALLCQLLYGTVASIVFPVGFAYLPVCVGERDLGPANGLLASTLNLANIVGPTFVALIALVTRDAAVAIVLDGVTFFAAALLMRGLPRGAATGGISLGGGIASLRAGWDALRRVRWLLLETSVSASMLFFVTAPFMVFGPSLVESHGSGAWALVMTAFGVGSVLGGMAAGAARPSRPVLWAGAGLGLLAFPPLALALDQPFWIICVAEAGAGVGIAAYSVLMSASIQESVESGLMARVSAVSSAGSFVLFPLGLLIAPVVAGGAGQSVVLIFGGLWAVAGTLVLVASRDVRAYRAEGPG
ncbi:MFS transporter [Acrocarpospora sp. B8E8]|uniref:MFS transporter n=1 Tax=Acrocarpospora sp. B8E8 TaxID=3153572 RepID=UPI00325F5D69